MHLCCLHISDCLMVGYSHASKLSCEMCLTSSCHSVYCGGSAQDVDPPKEARDTIFKQSVDDFVKKCSSHF